ncbi:MAG TPA: hypothetical protein VNY74_03300 [Edaphobacter sp.]|jgi:hypothetical protein|nr:hypothetical protein [Edaphobacter sp.]
MPRFSDLFSVRPGVRKGWIGAGFVGFGWLFLVLKTRVGGLTSENAGVLRFIGEIFCGLGDSEMRGRGAIWLE